MTHNLNSEHESYRKSKKIVQLMKYCNISTIPHIQGIIYHLACSFIKI